MTRPTKTVLTDLVDQKMSDPEIARELNVSSRTVLRWRIALDIPSQWKPQRADHGTYTRYTHGCRCRPCTDANTEACRAYRERRRAQS